MQTSFFWSKFDIQSSGVTLKMRSRSLKSNHFFPMSQQNPSFGSRDRVQTSFFWSNFDNSKCWCDLENEVKITKAHFYSLYRVTLKIRSRSPKSNQIFKPSQRYNRIRHLVQEIGCRQVFFWSKFYNSNLITSFSRPNNMSVQVWPKPTHWFKR